MQLKYFILQLMDLDGSIEIKYGGSNDSCYDPAIEAVEDTDTGEYYYRIVGE